MKNPFRHNKFHKTEIIDFAMIVNDETYQILEDAVDTIGDIKKPFHLFFTICIFDVSRDRLVRYMLPKGVISHHSFNMYRVSTSHGALEFLEDFYSKEDINLVVKMIEAEYGDVERYLFSKVVGNHHSQPEIRYVLKGQWKAIMNDPHRARYINMMKLKGEIL